MLTVPTSTGLLAQVAILDYLEDGVRLLLEGAVDLVVPVHADHPQVGRDLDHLEAVDLAEFGGLRHGRAGHAGELGEEAEIVLKGDRGQGLVFHLNQDRFLGLERLVQALGIAPPLHHAAGELVDDDDLVVLDDVIGYRAETACGRARPG